MTCRHCGHQPPAGSTFCNGCGAQLETTCANCGATPPPDSRFCNGCGAELKGATGLGGYGVRGTTSGADLIPSTPNPVTPNPLSYTPKHLADKILQSKSALEGERKQVTVLFADVKGSMELAEQLDPEEWHRILDRFFQILTDGVHRFEGTVNQYTGDGIMALFGAPIAHEDHAYRACYAALHLRDAVREYANDVRVQHGVPFGVRIGLNSGDVVVGKIGDDLRMDYTAQGHTVGLAQRMEALAESGHIVLSEHTARLVEGYFQLQNLGRSKVKGVTDPVGLFDLEGVGAFRTRLDRSRARGLSTFVGRERDMAVLETVLEQARSGDGQVVGVVAEAGTGKSRLCLEFVERCRRRGISVNEGHCPAHGKTVPYLPVLELLRGIFDIHDRDNEHEAQRKIAGELLLLDTTFQELLPLVFDFLNVPDPARPVPNLSPEARQRQLVAFVRHLTQARGQRDLRVLVIDDAHWIDAGSDAFLAQMVEAASGTRTLLLVNFRPEYHADWMSKSHYHQLPLLPLGRDATEELLADLFGRDPSLAGIPERIHARTRGNPFFIEELAQSLVESRHLLGSRGAYRLVASVEQLALPATVQAVLAARIDRLHEREKRLLQTASVIGKELPEPLLRRVAELADIELPAALAALVQGEFLIEKVLYPEAEFSFKHPLTHEVAYGSQLAERRARVHAAVARALEEIHAGRLDEQAALLAYHWEAAGDAATAAGWHARAARWCERDNFIDAHRHWSQVRALLHEAPARPEAILLLLQGAIARLQIGIRLGLGEEEARTILAEGRVLADRSGDLHSHARLLFSFGAVVGNCLGDPLSMREAVEEAIDLAAKSGDPNLRYEVCEGMIDFLHFTGQLHEAARWCDEWLDFGHAYLEPDARPWTGVPVAWLYGHRAWIESLMGRLGDAGDSLRRFEEEMRGRAATDAQGWVECVWAHNRAWAGDVRGAFTHARRALDSAEKYGSNIARVWAYHHLGVALGLDAEWEAAVEQLELALRTARETQSWLTIEAEILSHLAEARLGAGQEDEAQRTAVEAVESGRRRKTPVWEAQAHLALARVLLARIGAPARDEIESGLGSCLALIAQTQARVFEPHVHELRAELARLLGDGPTAAQDLREAHRLFSEIGASGHAQRLANEMGA